MDKQKQGFKLSELPGFFTSRLFFYTLIRLFLLFIILWTLNSFFLNIYTNHGQKLTMPKFIGVNVNKAIKTAEAKGYEMVVADSIHKVGVRGGIVISQVPRPASIVKRGRKIYVTVTRYNPDLILSDHLPDLYGKKFEFKKTELENAFGIRTKVVGFKFDPGPIGHIIEVRYQNELLADANRKTNGVQIAKGDTLYFILSTDKGGELNLPDLRCKTVAEVKFLLTASKLELGTIKKEGDVSSEDDAWVISQEPEYSADKKIKMGDSVSITISETRPEDCDHQ